MRCEACAALLVGGDDGTNLTSALIVSTVQSDGTASRAATEGKWHLDGTQTHLERWPCSFTTGVETFWVD